MSEPGPATTEEAPAQHDADEAHGRPVAPGGWRRIVIGLLVGLLAGAAIALAMPRDDGPRRRSLLDDLDDPGVDPTRPG
jgi:hypothetical protein